VVDYSERCSLSAGRAVILLGEYACMSLTFPATPAGVSHPFQSTLISFRFKSNNPLEKRLLSQMIVFFRIKRSMKSLEIT
jgi:hypothetical protein